MKKNEPTIGEMAEVIAKGDLFIKKDGTHFTAKEILEFPTVSNTSFITWYEICKNPEKDEETRKKSIEMAKKVGLEIVE